MDVTGLLRPYFLRRHKLALEAHDDIERTQSRVLGALLRCGAATKYGRAHGIDRRMTPQAYAASVPMVTYPDLRQSVMRMVAGEADVLWPGVCRRFAQSSGTTDGKSKYIPVTDDSLRLNHYHGGVLSVAHHLAAHPKSHLFSGRTFILGGSFANEVEGLAPGVKVGDLSAHLIDRINPLVERMRVPSRQTALMQEWEQKLPRLVEESLRADVTSISGVPSWFLTVLRRVVERAGASTIHDVWPRLEVFFHGGIAFGPYRSQYRAITDPARMHYLETYNASEGFFAVQDDPGNPAMLLMIDDGVYYEFLPLDAPDTALPLPSWQVEAGRTYELLITAPNGLWRYRPGDTVKVVDTHPLRITIAGRTKQYINAFGEELMVHNAEAAMAEACAATGADVANYTAAPVYTTEHSKGHHQWLVEFSRPPADLEVFADRLDEALQHSNSDYQAKRTHDIFLSRLQLTQAPTGLFDRWLASTGKLGGQRKVPRLCPDRRYIDPMLKMINTTGANM